MNSYVLAKLIHSVFILEPKSLRFSPQTKTQQKQNQVGFYIKISMIPMGNDTYRVFLLFVFILAWFPVADKIMQGAILHQSREDKDEANRYKEIHCCDIGDLGE